LLALARQVAGEAMARPSGAASPPEGAQELAREALRAFRAFCRELATASPTARAHALAFAVQSAIAQRLNFSAAAEGLDTARGLALLEQAAKCQGRAERSATAAIALVGLLGKPRAPTGDEIHRRIAAHFASQRQGSGDGEAT
jgi:hypothetical protein